MNRVTYTAITLFVVAIITWLIVRVDSADHSAESTRDEGVSTTVVDQPQIAVVKPEIAPESGIDNLLSLPALSRKLLEADSVTDALAAAALAHETGDIKFAIWAEGQISTQCHSSFSAERPMHESTRFAWEKLMKYCEGYSVELLSSLNEYLDSGGSYPKFETLQELEEIIGDMNHTERQEFLANFISTAETPYELNAAWLMVLKLNKRSPEYPVFLGQDPDIPQWDLTEIHAAAMILTKCRFFGGCGPDDATTLGICHTQGKCKPGWGVEEFFLQNLTPFKYEQLMKVLNFIRNQS